MRRDSPGGECDCSAAKCKTMHASSPGPVSKCQLSLLILIRTGQATLHPISVYQAKALYCMGVVLSQG